MTAHYEEIVSLKKRLAEARVGKNDAEKYRENLRDQILELQKDLNRSRSEHQRTINNLHATSMDLDAARAEIEALKQSATMWKEQAFQLRRAYMLLRWTGRAKADGMHMQCNCGRRDCLNFRLQTSDIIYVLSYADIDTVQKILDDHLAAET